MPRLSLDKDTKKALLEARNLVEANAKADGNEAETRARIRYIFGKLMGYDTFKHITAEYAIRGAGDTVHCDIAIQLSHEEPSKPDILVEIKRVNIDLTSTKLIESWDLLKDDLLVLNKKLEIVSYNNVRKQGLDKLWEKRNVLTIGNMLKAILSEESIKIYQRRIKKANEVTVSPEDIVGSLRHLLNEAALSEMDKMRISLPARHQHAKTSKAAKSKSTSIEQQAEAILAEKQVEE